MARIAKTVTPERLAEWIRDADGRLLCAPWIFEDKFGRPAWYDCEWERLPFWTRLRFNLTRWDPRGPAPYEDEGREPDTWRHRLKR